MIENPINHLREQREVAGMTVEVLSVGKNKQHPELNEDAYVASSTTFAVIDGSTPRIPILFEGQSGGKFAASVLKDVLESTEPDINGIELVNLMTSRLRHRMDEIGVSDSVKQSPDGRPAALFTAGRINGNKLIITAIGDVWCRINGKFVHQDRILTEEIMITKRVEAIKKAQSETPDISDDALRTIGRAAIEDDLKTQVRRYFNNPNDPLGLGIIDGDPVPDKFVKTYEFDLAEVDTLEIFSDGYYVIPEDATIDAYEQAFSKAEKSDPMRINNYPAVKTSTPEQYSDDRTILIVKKLVTQ